MSWPFTITVSHIFDQFQVNQALETASNAAHWPLVERGNRGAFVSSDLCIANHTNNKLIPKSTGLPKSVAVPIMHHIEAPIHVNPNRPLFPHFQPHHREREPEVVPHNRSADNKPTDEEGGVESKTMEQAIHMRRRRPIGGGHFPIQSTKTKTNTEFWDKSSSGTAKSRTFSTASRNGAKAKTFRHENNPEERDLPRSWMGGDKWVSPGSARNADFTKDDEKRWFLSNSVGLERRGEEEMGIVRAWIGAAWWRFAEKATEEFAFPEKTKKRENGNWVENWRIPG